MKRSFMTMPDAHPWAVALAVSLLVSTSCLMGPTAASANGELDETLSEVPGAYAQPYVTPVVMGTSANLTTGLYTNAAIGKEKLTFEIGVKFMGTYLSEDDQAFSKYQTITLDEDLGFDPTHPLYGREGVLEFVGPTAIGDTETDGQANVYVDGIQVRSEETISGVVDTRWIPLVVPEASVGGIAGLKFTLRFLPSVSLGDLGKLKVFGIGGQFCVNNLIQTLPIDVVVGLFYQNFDIGKSLSTDATNFFLGLSRTSGVLTLYGGGALVNSTTKVDYTWKSEDPVIGDVKVDFEVDGAQEYQLTIGAMVDVGIRLNGEINAGDLVVYSAGLMFGF